jgi:hypothetical protein
MDYEEEFSVEPYLFGLILIYGKSGSENYEDGDSSETGESKEDLSHSNEYSP